MNKENLKERNRPCNPVEFAVSIAGGDLDGCRQSKTVEKNTPAVPLFKQNAGKAKVDAGTLFVRLLDGGCALFATDLDKFSVGMNPASDMFQ